MEIDENVQIFISEGEELLLDMEDTLLVLEQDSDEETLNTIFRAAHTIKGSAGLFGLDYIVEFTHVVENVLDDMRNCLIPTSSELITVLMRSKDFIASLIAGIEDDYEGDKSEKEDLINLLNAFKAGSVSTMAESINKQEEKLNDPQQASEEQGTGSAETDNFHISVRFGPDTFRLGFNPVVIFRQLEDLGEIKQAVLVSDIIPVQEEIDPEQCYLGYEIALQSMATKEQISEVFDLIEGVELHVLPPKSLFSDYKHLIEQVPEDELALGQILMQIGTLTESELQFVLKLQNENLQAGMDPQTQLTGKLLVEKGMVQEDVVEEALKKQSNIRENKQKALNFVKVDSNKLDKLINLVGELVINGAKLDQIAATIADEDLNETIEGLTLALEDLREISLGLRMVPIGMTFNRFHRVIRDLSNEMGKQVRLEIYGADTELDKTVIEKIGDPLMHLIRNSLDHGIESPQERALAGKNVEGLITLQAQHEAGYITIQVIDDGQGLDPEKLKRKAQEKGLITETSNLTDKEAFNLIFAAGFSTAEQVSNISGRGVGMDVVRRNIESLRGNIYIDSQLGKGTTITIQLPLTLAIIDGFNVRLDQESYIFPLDMVHECITLTNDQIEEAAQHNYITLRDEVLPVVHLREYFDNTFNGVPAPVIDRNKRINLVVVMFSNRKIGLFVDELLGEVQAVIKPLGRVFKDLNGFAGFTILGSGMVALVLDVPSLINQVIGDESRHFEAIKNDSIRARGNKVIH
jgi:two-component system, chemotaxis family, sensor kinase CheA